MVNAKKYHYTDVNIIFMFPQLIKTSFIVGKMNFDY